jgi:apolipoprotein N-acyltransferase
VAFEFLHYNWELHWPWLTLGNAFASWPWAIQWYDISGVLGGSVWALLMNWLLYQAFYFKEGRIKNFSLAGILLFGGIIFSLLWYPAKKVNPERVNLTIVQPNFEPHFEKFDIPKRDQLNKIKGMIEAGVSDSTDYLILPETVFTFNLNHLQQEAGYLMLQSIQEKHPALEIIVGLATQRVLGQEEESNQFTRLSKGAGGRDIRWEAANTAMFMQKGETELYYKSKLVPGAEFFPYHDYLFFLQPIVDKLEGSIEGFRTQEEVSVFKGQAKVAPIICYESIFGAYCRKYIKKGADLFTVITNDGWWDNTPGHMQHFAYAKLLAIQHRRAIARAANTGISALIYPNGNVKEMAGYEEDSVIIGSLPLHKEISFYSRWGDLLGRISLFILAVVLLQGIYLIVKNRFPTNDVEE